MTKSETELPGGTITVITYGGLRTPLAPGERLDIFRDDGSRFGTLVYGTRPAEPEQADPWNGHEWMQREQDYYAFCRVCGTVRRADDKNKPCKGPVRIELRAEPEQADEVAGLRIPESDPDHVTAYGHGWNDALRAVQRARLAPARDE